ncbi:MAG: DNA translocase FtsK [Christensenellales bacterium]
MYYSNRKNRKAIKWQWLILTCVCFILVVVASCTFSKPVGTFLFGLFGILLYPISLILALIGVAKCLRFKFSRQGKNVVYLCFVFGSLALLLHIAFLGNYIKVVGAKIGNYFDFLGKVLSGESGLTIGGAILTLISYPFVSLLGVVGASIFFAILLTIFTSLTIDYYINLKKYYDFTNSPRINSRDVPGPNAYTTSSDSIANSINTLNGPTEVVPTKNNEEDYIGLLKPDEKIENPYITDEYDSLISTKTGESVKRYANKDQEPIKESAINTLYGKSSVEGFEDDNLANNEKANSHYDPSKFDSPLDYITTPYAPNIFNNINKQEDEQEDTNSYSSYSLNDNEEYTEGEQDSILPQNDPFVFNDLDTKTEDNTSASAFSSSNDALFSPLNSRTNDRENRSERRRERESSRIESPFSPFNAIDTQQDRNKVNGNDDKFISPAVDFFNQSPKKEAEQISLIDRKPQKQYKHETDDHYNAPPTTLLQLRSDDESTYGGDYKSKIVTLEKVLRSFNIEAKVGNVVRGPSVTQYELEMPYGVSVKRILPFDNDITSALMSKSPVRIEAPILGKNAVGIEVANDKRSTVGLREVLESKEFQNTSVTLPVVIGKSISGEIVVKSLPKMVHMLVAGSTGSGKSIFLHSLILSLMYKCSPSQLRFIMIDPKRVEFTGYSGMPHMMLPNAVCECDKAINALSWAVKEMDRRFKKLSQYRVQNISDFNHCSAVTETHEETEMPYIVIVIDELADLMMIGKKDVEEKIMRLAQLGRASGIHMIIATQRPSADIITGTIKNNLPTRVAFSLGSSVDSRVILDETGAEKLLGAGDMLFAPHDSNTTTRLQGAFMSMDEVKRVVDYIKEHNASYFDEEVAKEILSDKKEEQTNEGNGSGNYDPNAPDIDELLPAALKLCIETGGASINMVQRRFRVGYARAARIIDQMELAGYISPGNGSKIRTVYMTKSEFNEKFGEDN